MFSFFQKASFVEYTNLICTRNRMEPVSDHDGGFAFQQVR